MKSKLGEKNYEIKNQFLRLIKEKPKKEMLKLLLKRSPRTQRYLSIGAMK